MRERVVQMVVDDRGGAATVTGQGGDVCVVAGFKAMLDPSADFEV